MNDKNVIFLFFLLISTCYSEQILFAWQINRHGARAPYLGVANNLDAYKEYWPVIEELSSVGKRMLYLLGAKVRNKYIKGPKKFLSEEYNPQEILIRSTEVNRTIESIESYLQGLYPQGTGPKINAKISKDERVYPPNKKYYKEFDELLVKFGLNQSNYSLPNQISIEPIHTFYKPAHEFELYNTDLCKGNKEVYEKQKKRPEVSAFGDKLLSNFGEIFYDLENNRSVEPFHDYWNLFKYTDGYICDDVEKKNFDYLKTKFNFNEDQAILLKKLSKEYLWMDYTETNYPSGHPEIPIVANSYTMHSIVNWMEKALQAKKDDKNYLKFVIYSAHDSSIGAIEHFMKIAFDVEVDYSEFAESRFIELYLDDNNNPKVRYIRGNDSIKFDLTFKDFKKKIQDNTWDDKKVAELCKFDDTKKKGEGNTDQGSDNITDDEKGINAATISLIILAIIDSICGIVLIILCIKKN